MGSDDIHGNIGRLLRACGWSDDRASTPAEDLARGMARALTDTGQVMLVIDRAAHSARIVDEAEIMRAAGGSVVIINSRQQGKTLRADEALAATLLGMGPDLTAADLPGPVDHLSAPDLKRERMSKRPSYLDHDPTKHGKLKKRPNNHRYARTKR